MIDELLAQGVESPTIEMGSIGWEDEDEYVEFGAGTEDGHTLIRVQLFRGRDTTKPLNPKRAQGHKIVCHISGGLFRVPKKDTRCYVAIPPGMETVPGAGVVFATIEPSPPTQFAKDRAVLDFGDDVHVIFKGKSVTLQDPDFRFLCVGTPRSGGTPGVQVHLPDGTGAAWQENAFATFCQDGTIVQMTSDKFEVWQKDGAILKMGSGQFYTFGSSGNLVLGAGVFLGRETPPPSLATPAVYGPLGITGMGSTCVFISP